MTNQTEHLATIEHAGVLDDVIMAPAYILSDHRRDQPRVPDYSCSYCGVGDGGFLVAKDIPTTASISAIPEGEGVLLGKDSGIKCEAKSQKEGRIVATTNAALTMTDAVLNGTFTLEGKEYPVTAREIERQVSAEGVLHSQTFVIFNPNIKATQNILKDHAPTTGCVKLGHSQMRQRVAFPIHIAPSILDHDKNQRQQISYEAAIKKLADLILAHRGPNKRVLLYACGQIDYFTIFAIQEIFRLLGVRNLTGNAEHCLNSGAVHNELLTGQEGPFLTIENAIRGSNRFYLFNGWNGLVSHPPVFGEIMKREDLDAYMVEVAVTESALMLAEKLGPERVLIIKPRTDAHLVLAIAHQILKHHTNAIEERFIKLFAKAESYDQFTQLAASDQFKPEVVAERIAPEPEYVERILNGIKAIAQKLVDEKIIPINIPSVGLSQSSGVVAHCLWGSVMAMLGKYGLKEKDVPAGGTLRLPGQINAETEVQGLSRNFFMGRVPMKNAAEAAKRMGLPEDAYDAVVQAPARAALDYSEPTPGTQELFICIGTQFEANMMGRERWIRKLLDPDTKFVVIDPIPDPFSLEYAELIMPSPPHPATTKVYQNGEWRLSLLAPQKIAPKETRTDATILYDVMAEIGQRLESDAELAKTHADLYRHIESGYIQKRFMPPRDNQEGLLRADGEVSRPQLWQRIIDYFSAGSGPIYCRPEHEDGKPITWDELLKQRSIIYGGVGKTRYILDYSGKATFPFRDIYRQERPFTFFLPTEADLSYPTGIIFNTGRSSLSTERKRILFAIGSFNSGKATPIVDMPDEHPLYVSLQLAKRFNLATGDLVRVKGRVSGGEIILPVVVSDRVKGESTYVSFQKSLAQIEKNCYVNDVTSYEGRCPYTGQTNLKVTPILLEKVEAQKISRPNDVTIAIRRTTEMQPPSTQAMDTTLIDPKTELPIWQGQLSPLYVTDIIQETHDTYTFRFQGNPLCRFIYWPGQFCTLVLNINGKKVIRSYSISSSPTRPFILEITIKRVPGGLVSNWLPDNLKIGDRVDIAGPKGKFCLVPGKIPKKLFFIAGGSGVTPLMSMSRWLNDISANIDVKFFNSVRTPKDIIFRNELGLLTTRSKQFEPVIVTATRTVEEGWMGLSGLVNSDMIKTMVPDFLEREIFMCGPPAFMEAVQKILRDMNYNLVNLRTESFSGLRTSPTDKPVPTYIAPTTFVPGQTPQAKPEEKKGNITVEFVKSKKQTLTDGVEPILDLAEDQDINIDYGCRMGSCGDCKVKLLAGEVVMDNEEGLTPEEKAQKYILTCVAKPTTNCKIDA